MVAAGREQRRDRVRFVYVTRFGSHQCGAVLQLGGRRAQGPCSPGLGAGRSREEPRAAVAGAAGGGELCPGSPPRAPAASSPARASSSRSRPRQEAHAGGAKGRAGGDSGGGPRPVEGSDWVAQRPPRLAPAWPRAVGGPPVRPGAERQARPALRCCPERALKCKRRSFEFSPRSESERGGSWTEPLKSLRMMGPWRLTQKNLAKKFDFPIPLNEASKIMKKKKKVSVWNGVYKVISKMLEENEKYRLRLKCQQLSSENSNYTR
ncbi:uncharacterized protein C5orf47 homolog [Eubalaena glacialis]|uniref:uncharacterized protein C5orf47 homolog n=1 Tax=Eubalaena glacialis TaxID=27606 RepID=UPI002A59B1A0|nr:uncharacterized protein C5orf47 homolog [Eubalaena glacialis]